MTSEVDLCVNRLCYVGSKSFHVYVCYCMTLTISK